jgi:hypothetical protein
MHLTWALAPGHGSRQVRHVYSSRRSGRAGREKGVRALNQPAQEIPTTKNARAVRRPLSLLPQPAVLRIRFSRAPPQFTTHLFHSPSTLLNFSESSLWFSFVPSIPLEIDKGVELACSLIPTLSAGICARALFVWHRDASRRSCPSGHCVRSQMSSSSLVVSPRSFTRVSCLMLNLLMVRF